MEDAPLRLLPPLRTLVPEMIQSRTIIAAPVNLPEIPPESIIVPGELLDGKAVLPPVQRAVLGEVARVPAPRTVITRVHAALAGELAVAALVARAVAVVADLLGTAVAVVAADAAQEAGQLALQRAVPAHMSGLVAVEAFRPRVLQKVPPSLQDDEARKGTGILPDRVPPANPNQKILRHRRSRRELLAP